MSSSSLVSGLSEASGVKFPWGEVSQESPNNRYKSVKIGLLRALVRAPCEQLPRAKKLRAVAARQLLPAGPGAGSRTSEPTATTARHTRERALAAPRGLL